MKTASEIYHAHKSPISRIKPEPVHDLFPEQEEKKKKPSKFLNKWVVIDGIKFQSIGEGGYYEELKRRLARGDIKEFKRQIVFEFVVNGVEISSYKADFGILHFDGTIEILDYKSQFTAQLAYWQIKKQLMLACYQIAVKEVGVNLKKK